MHLFIARLINILIYCNATIADDTENQINNNNNRFTMSSEPSISPYSNSNNNYNMTLTNVSSATGGGVAKKLPNVPYDVNSYAMNNALQPDSTVGTSSSMYSTSARTFFQSKANPTFHSTIENLDMDLSNRSYSVEDRAGSGGGLEDSGGVYDAFGSEIVLDDDEYDYIANGDIKQNFKYDENKVEMPGSLKTDANNSILLTINNNNINNNTVNNNLNLIDNDTVNNNMNNSIITMAAAVAPEASTASLLHNHQQAHESNISSNILGNNNTLYTNSNNLSSSVNHSDNSYSTYEYSFNTNNGSSIGGAGNGRTAGMVELEYDDGGKYGGGGGSGAGVGVNSSIISSNSRMMMDQKSLSQLDEDADIYYNSSYGPDNNSSGHEYIVQSSMDGGCTTIGSNLEGIEELDEYERDDEYYLSDDQKQDEDDSAAESPDCYRDGDDDDDEKSKDWAANYRHSDDEIIDMEGEPKPSSVTVVAAAADPDLVELMPPSSSVTASAQPTTALAITGGAAVTSLSSPVTGIAALSPAAGATASCLGGITATLATSISNTITTTITGSPSIIFDANDASAGGGGLAAASAANGSATANGLLAGGKHVSLLLPGMTAVVPPTKVTAKQRWHWAYNKIIMQLNVSTLCQ